MGNPGHLGSPEYGWSPRGHEQALSSVMAQSPRELTGTYLHDADVIGAVQLTLLDDLFLQSGQVPLQVFPLTGVLLLQVCVQPCDLHLMGQRGFSVSKGRPREKGGLAREVELTMSARCTYFSKRPRTLSFSAWGSWIYATQL